MKDTTLVESRSGSIVRRLAIACAALVAITGTSPAAAQVSYFNFVVPGFNKGAILTGSFSGQDLDGSGFLEYDRNTGVLEVTDFTASFSGNAIGPFTLSTADLTRLRYDFDGSFGGGGEGIDAGKVIGPSFVAVSGGNTCTAGNGCFVVASFAGGQFEFSNRFGTVRQIAGPGAPAPELGAGLLASLAAAAALFLARRRKATGRNGPTLAFA